MPNEFNHLEALNGAPVWCGESLPYPVRLAWKPFFQRWVYEEIDEDRIYYLEWDKNGVPQSNDYPPLTTIKPGT